MLGVTTVKLRIDSQLVVRQAMKEFLAKEPQIVKYMATLEQLIRQFAHFEVEKIYRSLNNSADALAKLASAYEGGQREILVNAEEHPSCTWCLIRKMI